jgi:hypothetical protein
MRLSEEITAEEYSLQKRALIDAKLRVKQNIEIREQSANRWLELAERFFETAFKACEIMKSNDGEAKRGLVQAVGSNLFLKEKKVEFSFKKPFDILLKADMRSNVQG